MYKLCKTEQSAQRQTELEMGLLAAMETKPYNEISVSDLCQQMGIPRKAFYRYFSCKDGALQALIDHAMMEFLGLPEAISKGRKRNVQKEIQAYFEYWYNQKRLLDALDRNDLSSLVVDRMIVRAREEGIKLGAHQQKDVMNLALSFMMTGMMALVLNWHHQGYQPPVEQMAAMTTQILLKPMLTGQ